MIKLTSPAAMLILAAMIGLGPLATSVYLPAFPAMAQAFGVGPDQIKLTLSVYVTGLALSQLVCGPLADRFGRKPVVVSGLVLFCLGSIGCASADNIGILLGYRFLQACGAAAGMVLAQAIVRDTFSGHDAARTLAYMASTTALAPAIAPLIGGLLLVRFGWPSTFILLALYALLVLIIVFFKLPESLPQERRQALHPAAVLRNYLTVGRHPTFLGHVIATSLVFAGYYAFLTGSPFVLISLFGVPEHHFGWYFMPVVAAFIIGNLTGAKLGFLLSARQLIITGSIQLICAGIMMVLAVLLNLSSPVALIGAQLLFAMGSGIMMPQLITGALMHFRHMAGTAAALMGFMQMGAAAISSSLVAGLHDNTALPMVLTIAAVGPGALITYTLLVPRVKDEDSLTDSSAMEGSGPSTDPS